MPVSASAAATCVATIRKPFACRRHRYAKGKGRKLVGAGAKGSGPYINVSMNTISMNPVSNAHVACFS